MTKDSKDEKDKKRRRLALQKRYGQRITIARHGRESFLAKDYLAATSKYNEYLAILSEMNELDDVFSLTPAMFDDKTQLTEMLLISHVYWELSRIHENAPKLQKTYYKALSQFVKFTVNQPYQVFNAEMLRKFLKKNKQSAQYAALTSTYQQIFVKSKKCYIATYCFGDTHPTTNELREFKQILLKYKSGQKFVELYYRYSPALISYSYKRPKFGKALRRLITPALRSLAKATRTSRL